MKSITFIQPRSGRSVTTYVDDDDYINIKNMRLVALVKGTYIYVRIGKNDYLPLPNVLLGQQKSVLIDHINRNSLDNTRSNLRVVNRCENMLNRVYPKTSSNRPGVYFDSHSSSWRVNFGNLKANKGMPGIRKRFKNLEDAIKHRESLEKSVGIEWEISDTGEYLYMKTIGTFCK